MPESCSLNQRSVCGLQMSLASAERMQGFARSQSLMNYSPTKAGQMFFKITAASPQMISCIKTFIEGGVRLSVPSGWDAGGNSQVQVPPMAYEANIPFVLRFMVDTQMTGCSWLTRRQEGSTRTAARQSLAESASGDSQDGSCVRSLQ